MEPNNIEAVPVNGAKRKRGGQVGNRNAVKHGFYSEQFKEAERLILSQVENIDLSSEIELLRVEIRRYLEAETQALNKIDYEARLMSLRTVSLAVASLTRMVRMQIILNTLPPEGQIAPKESFPTKENDQQSV